MLRKKPGEEKSKCALTFKITLEIPLSIAASETISDDFQQHINNIIPANSTDYSKVLRDLLYKELGLKTKKDIDLFFEKEVNSARERIYTKLNVGRGNSFSHVMSEKIIKYTKRV